MKKICIAGTQSGVGKTTVTMAVLALLAKKMRVQPFKVGPDYIDPMFHSLITGQKSRNLDSYLMPPEAVKYLFERNTINKDIAVIEGVMGLFDGAEIGSDIGTTASIAKQTDTPIILIVDGSKIAGSIAAIVKGFEQFDCKLRIVGAILNNVSSEHHYRILKEAIELYTEVEPLGYLIKDLNIELPERHLGLVPTEELSELEKKIDYLAQMASNTIDIKRILQLAEPDKQIDKEVQAVINNNFVPQIAESKLRIAYAKDQAFHFYYEDNLEYLKKAGVELIPFSPLHDRKLPEDIQGLIIGGGFPEIFAKELSQNTTMKKSVLQALEKGLPYYVECGGLMYLCKELYDLDNEKHDMVDWFEGNTRMQKRLQRFGYAKVTLDQKCLFGSEGDTIYVHEFHRSKAELNEKTCFNLCKIKQGKVIKEWTCGFVKGAGIGSYAHIHFYSNLKFADSFVNYCQQYKSKEESNHGIH